jgi:DNA-binding PadR family transcriptional regulator
VRLGILALLVEAPRNGYQIMQELESRSRGMWRPSPGSVYPALQLLEDEGLVRAEAGEGSSRLFVLTDKGKESYEKTKGEEAPWDAVAGDEQAPAIELFQLMRGIGGALMQVAQGGNAQSIAAAKKILTDARKALY